MMMMSLEILNYIHVIQGNINSSIEALAKSNWPRCSGNSSTASL